MVILEQLSAPWPIVLSMIILATDLPPEPYIAPRGICPDCGSWNVRHLVAGPFEDRSEIEDPEWVEWQGILRSCDRECEICGLQWWCERENPSPVRLLSEAGAAFALLPVAELDEHELAAVDIELLSPDRMVRYLGRTLASNSIAVLRNFWMKAAEEARPELTVPTFQDDEAQFSISVVESTDRAVTLEFSIISDPTSDVPSHDGLAFDVARSDLIAAALEVADWTGEDADDEEWDV